MKRVILVFSILAINILNAQMENNSFNLNNNKGDLTMRRYVDNDFAWKRALVSLGDVLSVNYAGDYRGGTHIMGSKLLIDGTVGIGVRNPYSKLSVHISGANNSNFPTTTTKGDAIQTVSAHNNILEFGVARGVNARRSWILTRHLDTKKFGKHYGTLHLQPDIGFKSYYHGVAIGFLTKEHTPNNVGLAVKDNVTIGTLNSKGYKLAVAGKKGIIAEEVTVKLKSNWPDYVFENNYKLPTLKEVEQQIKEEGHLKNIPTAKEVKESGVKLGEMNKKLLQKIEELTLYTIQQQKEIEAEREKNNTLEQRLSKLEKLVKQKID